MSSLLVVSLLLGAAAVRVDSVRLSDTGARTAVRVDWTGTPALVAVHREGNVARVSMSDAELGLVFAGGSRFAFTSATAPAPASSAPFQGLDIESRNGEVFFYFRVSPETPIDVQRGKDFMIVSFRAGGPPAGTLIANRPGPSMTPMAALRQSPARVAAVTPPPPPPPALAPPAPPVATPPVADPVAPPVREAQSAPAPLAAPTGLAVEVSPAAPTAEAPPPAQSGATVAPPAADTASLHQRLFPVPSETPAYEPTETSVPSSDLYSKLFPYAAEAAPAPSAATEAVSPAPEELAPGLRVGPVTLRPGVRVGYVDAEANFLTSPEPVRDQYLEIQPKMAADMAVGAGHLSLSYEPILRALGSYEATRSTTHPVELTLDAPLGTRGRLKIADTFVRGLLETAQVDPGGEYFFDLGRFNKNAVGANASIDVGPRLSVELGGGYDWVDFTESSSFFGYQRAMGSLGLGFEATPTLKTTFSYVYDRVPSLDDRPEAESRAHSLQVGLLGDILPLLRGSVTVGYRDHKSPNAAAGGTSYRGLTASATLTRDLGREAAVTLLVNRSTPLSSFEGNSFYVTTAVAASFLAPLPYSIALSGGGGYHWNDYRTLVAGETFPREDRLVGWFVGLRRPIDRRISAFAGYRWERRRSNLETFENDTDGFLFQLDVDVFGRSH